VKQTYRDVVPEVSNNLFPIPILSENEYHNSRLYSSQRMNEFPLPSNDQLKRILKHEKKYNEVVEKCEKYQHLNKTLVKENYKLKYKLK